MKKRLTTTILLPAILTIGFFILGTNTSNALKQGDTGSLEWKFDVEVVDPDGNTIPGLIDDEEFMWEFRAVATAADRVFMRSTGADANPDPNIHGFNVQPKYTSISLDSFSLPEGYEFQSITYTPVGIEDAICRGGTTFTSDDPLPYVIARGDAGCGYRATFQVFKGVVVSVRSNQAGIPFRVCQSIRCTSYVTNDDPVQKYYFANPSGNINYTVAVNVPEGDNSLYEVFDSADGRSSSYPPLSYSMERLGETAHLDVSLNRYQVEPQVNLEAFIFGEAPESISAEGGSNSDFITAPAGSQITLVWNSIGANTCDPSWSTEPEAASGKTSLTVPAVDTTYTIKCTQ